MQAWKLIVFISEISLHYERLNASIPRAISILP
jgi:hypothetical protein